MKTILSSLFCSLLVFGLATDVSAYMKIGDIKGETTDDRSASSSSTAAVQVRATTASSSSEEDDDDDRGDDDRTSRSSASSSTSSVEDITPEPEEGVEPDEIDYDDSSSSAAAAQNTSASSSTPKKKGKVDASWQIEEGEAMEMSSSSVGTLQTQPQEGVEPDEIDARNTQKNEEEDDRDFDDNEGPLETNFALLLDSNGSGGGGGDDDEDDETSEDRQRIADILLQGAQAEDVPMEELSLNFEKIKAKVKHDVKLLGLIPVTVHPTVEIDANARVEVKFPWWAFLASGKRADVLGEAVRDVLSDIIGREFQ